MSELDLSGNKILVVDDEMEIRENLVETLEMHNATTKEACNGQEALELIKKEHFDIMLTDLNMPEMHGFQLIQELSDLDTSIVIVVLSGHDTIQNYKLAVQHGIFDFIPKPFSIEGLVTVVARAAEKSQMIGLEKSIMQCLFQFIGQNSLMDSYFLKPPRERAVTANNVLTILKMKLEKLRLKEVDRS